MKLCDITGWFEPSSLALDLLQPEMTISGKAGERGE